MAREGLSPIVIGLVILGLLVCSLFIYFQIVRGMADSDPVADVPPPGSGPLEAPPPSEPRDPEPDLPTLDASDEAVRRLATRLSEHPQLAAWLTPERLVRRFVAAVVNTAEGVSPRPHLDFLEPEADFGVVELEGRTFVDRKSYGRYDLLAEVFASLDTVSGARLYERLKPLLDNAYQDLGYPAGEFDAALSAAIDRVLLTPIPSERVMLKRRISSYRFADRSLESLSAVEKHLLRMGPDNARKVQAKLREMRTALGL